MIFKDKIWGIETVIILIETIQSPTENRKIIIF